MTNRRKFLLGMGSLAAGGAAAMGSGAFTSVSADRAVEVSVADDSNALLALDGMDTPNGNNYVFEDGGTIGIDIPGDATGDGVNREATTIVRDLFSIENQGTQPVYIWIEDGPDGIGWFADGAFASADDPAGTTTDTGLAPGGQPSNWPLGKSYSGRHLAGPGDVLDRVGLYVTDPAALESDSATSVNIWAATLDEIASAQRGAYDFSSGVPSDLEAALSARDTRRGADFPGSY